MSYSECVTSITALNEVDKTKMVERDPAQMAEVCQGFWSGYEISQVYIHSCRFRTGAFVQDR